MKSDIESLSYTIESFDDGQRPGGTNVPTKIVRYLNKQAVDFFCMFDNLLPEEWCDKAYEYAVEKQKPWGRNLKSR